MSDFYCYIHKRKDGTPFYVGKGVLHRAYEFSRRTLWHRNIVAKEGRENIQIEIYKAVDETNAFELERIFIKGLRLFFDLCNLTDGGEGISGLKRSEETKRKISLANKGNTSFLGKHHTAESKALISEARKTGSNNFGGKHHTDESKQKISKALTGITRSKETTDKWRKAMLERKETS